MKICQTSLALVMALSCNVEAFTTTSPAMPRVLTTTAATTTSTTLASTAATAEDEAAAAGVPPATSEASANTEDVEIPTNLPSDCGMDYIPLATMLATGQLAEADQVGSTCYAMK